MSVLPEFHPQVPWQRCVFHFHHNIIHEVSPTKRKVVGAMLKAVHAQEHAPACRRKAEEIAVKLEEMKLRKAAKIFQKFVRLLPGRTFMRATREEVISLNTCC